jgi:hypothetical protein
MSDDDFNANVASSCVEVIQNMVPDGEEAVACLGVIVASVLHQRFGIIIREAKLMLIAKAVLACFRELDAEQDREDETP